MATDETSSAGLLYLLCAIAAIGVLADVILLVWQLMTYKLERGFRFVKGSLILLDGFYALTGLAVILLLLYQDVAAGFLCKAGGFLILFATQEVVWVLATSSVALLLWKRKALSRDFQRRNVSIFILIICAQSLILMTISFLPFTNIRYFDTVAEYYFRCTPLRLPGEQGWAFSTLVLILNWIVIGVSVVTLTVVSVRYSKCTEPELSPAGRLIETVTSKKRLQRQVFLALCIACGGWITTHVLVCISYFSGDRLNKGTIQWLLGFCISVCLNLHPLTFLVHSLLCKWVFPRYRKDPTGLKALLDACPRSLESVQRQHGGPQQDPGIVTFLTRWRDKAGCQQTGSMKVFTPGAQEKWRHEVNAVTRVGALSHPNVAPYLWVSPQNAFSTYLNNTARISLSKRSLLVCRLHYPSGTLYSFLQNRIHQLTEIGLHKITLDVASGLEHIHQHHLVHNGLTTSSVYMASISEKIGLKAVIGDLENSYEVPASSRSDSTPTKLPTAKPWSSGSQLPDLFSITGRIEVGSTLTNNRFAPDIRSFGMVVLEMLMALTEYNQKKRLRLKVSSRATNESRHSMYSLHSFDDIPQRSAMTEIKGATAGSSSTDPDMELPLVASAHPLHHHHHHHHHASGEPCTCSSSVTNVRAVRRGNNSKHSGYSFQLGNLGSSHQIKSQSINNPAATSSSGASRHAPMSDLGSLDSIDEIDLVTETAKPVLPSSFNSSAGGAQRPSYVSPLEGQRKSKPWEIQQYKEEGGPPHGSQDVCEQSQRSPEKRDSVPKKDNSGSHKHKVPELDQLKPAPSHRAQGFLPVFKCPPPPPPRPSIELPLPDSSESETDSSRSPHHNGQVTPSGRRGSGHRILTNGSFLTPRSTPEHLRPPSRPPRKADACTDTADFVDFDSNESIPSVTERGLEILPEATLDLDDVSGALPKASTEEKVDSEYHASKQFYSNGFQTIYEEEDGAKAGVQKEQRKLQKVPLTRRRLPPVPNSTDQQVNGLTSAADMARRKRNSMVSLDESVVSVDSGVGSSHYDMSDQSSVYFSNVPGTRQPFYVADGAGQSDSEVYGPMKTFLGKRQSHKPQDSGIDSSADSCDELNKQDGPKDLNTKTSGSSKSGSRPTTQDPDEENVYEVVSDNSSKGLRVKKKKPCVGHHEGVGHTCCSLEHATLDTIDRNEHKRTSTNSRTKEKDQSPRKPKQDSSSEADMVNGPNRQLSAGNKEEAGVTKANVEAQWKKLVDTATNTSDQDDCSSLEGDQQKGTLPPKDYPTESKQQQRPAATSHTTPVFTKLEAALLDELLDLRQQNNASRGAGTILGEEPQQYGVSYHHHHQAEEEACASHCSNCKRIYSKRQCEVVGGYLQPVPSRRRAVSNSTNSFKLSSSSSSPSSLLHHSLSSQDNLSASSYSGEGGSQGSSTSRLPGLGYRQVAQMQQLLQPRGLAASGSNQEMRRLLDGVQKNGNLGYIAGQLVPLLSECWTDDPVPTADDILHKLCEVLPTAAV